MAKRFSYEAETKTRLKEIHDAFDDNMANFQKYSKESDKLFRKLKRDTNKYYHLWDYFKRLDDEYEETTDIEKKKLLRIKMDKISSKMAETKKRNKLLEFELDLIDDYVDFYHKGYNKYNDKFENFPYLTDENSNVKTITKAKVSQLEKEICCICLDCHKTRDIVTTQCGHIFGKKCFERIIDDKGDNTSCPYCRKRGLQFTLYRKKSVVKTK